MNYLKFCYVGFLITGFIFGCVGQNNAQTSQEYTVEMQPISDSTRIWTGTARFRWYSYYVAAYGEVGRRSRTKLDFQLRHLWLSNQNFGFGVQGMTQFYIRSFFENLELGSGALGPLMRVYPWQNNRWQFYLQSSGMIGYDLALSDAQGANRGEGIRYRFGLRSGLSYRVSNKFGIYVELGPDWEADDSFEFDSRAFQLDIGIQLFRFN